MRYPLHQKKGIKRVIGTKKSLFSAEQQNIQILIKSAHNSDNRVKAYSGNYLTLS